MKITYALIAILLASLAITFTYLKKDFGKTCMEATTEAIHEKKSNQTLENCLKQIDTVSEAAKSKN